jgi:acylphosphatase
MLDLIRVHSLGMGHEAETERREVLYAGRVQGVGFRLTARSLALRFTVTGFVQNLSDGRVRMVVEGPVDQVRGASRAVGEAMRENIEATDTDSGPALGDCQGFSIRF